MRLLPSSGALPLVTPPWPTPAPLPWPCTGTVMRGGARVGDTLELPELRVQKTVKGMQMFK